MALIRETGQVQGDRVPPQSVELEMCVLGAVMLEPREAFNVAADFLGRDSFYLDGHGVIFELMGELIHRGIPPDSVAVLDELRSRQLLEKVGGSGVIMAMLNSVPTAANVEYHSRKVAEKAHLRQLIRGCTEVIEEAYKQERPLDQILDYAESTVLRLSARSNLGEFIPISSVLQQYWEKLDDRELRLREMRAQGIQNPKLPTGLTTGYVDLDTVTGGLRDSELTIIAARPSVGKTALALNFAHNMAVENHIPVAVFSLEMGNEQLAERLLCLGTKYTDRASTIAGIKSNRLQNPDLTDEEWGILTKSYERLMTAPIFLDDSSILTSTMLKAKARRLASKYKIGCIIVDYLQLMSGSGGSSDNRVQEVSEISRALKQIARELKIPVIALSQLSRQVESRQTKRPHLSDLRESGAIEQDADVVMFIHREDYYGNDNARSESSNPYSMEGTRLPTAEIIVAKNRNGPTDSVRLLWFKEITRFLSSTGR
jgi:replicative DNA helicase